MLPNYKNKQIFKLFISRMDTFYSIHLNSEVQDRGQLSQIPFQSVPANPNPIFYLPSQSLWLIIIGLICRPISQICTYYIEDRTLICSDIVGRISNHFTHEMNTASNGFANQESFSTPRAKGTVLKSMNFQEKICSSKYHRYKTKD